MKTQQRILLSEDTKGINDAKRTAEFNASRLNEIADIYFFESEAEFKSRTQNIDAMLCGAILRVPTLAKLAESVQMSSIKVPGDIQDATDTLRSLTKVEGFFNLLSCDGSDWSVDPVTMAAFEESHRVYAIGETQIERYEAATALCKFLNAGEYGYALFTQAEFANIMIDWSLQENCWTVNNRWVVS